jgi:hypothetical protein
MTSLLTEGLVERGLDVTLFGTADSRTKGKLHATFPHGYWHDEDMWPWELYEMLNLAAAVERAPDFDIIHYEAAYYPISLAFARLSPTPLVQTSPLAERRRSRAVVAIKTPVRGDLGQPTSPVSTSSHRASRHRYESIHVPRDSGRLPVVPGRFTEGSVLQAIEVAKRAGIKLILAAADEAYYYEKVALP